MGKDEHLEIWREVWERKGKEPCDKKLADLIRLDGFDKGAGKMTEEIWLRTAGVIRKELELQKGDHLLEVGCGSGAMLLPLSKVNIQIAGIDYSESLIKVAQTAIPDATFKVAEARSIPFADGTFSKVFLHSVFQYFSDLEYAEEVLREMRRVLQVTGKILIMDVPDTAKKETSESERLQAGSTPPPGGNSAYTHLYYDKSFFEDFAKTENMKVKIFDQNIKEYGNSPFRFNVLLWRDK